MRIHGIAFALSLAVGGLSGCTTVHLTEANFLFPDNGVETPAVATGRVVERYTVDSVTGPIAVTRVGKPGNRTVVLYCGGNQFRVGMHGGGVVEGLPADVDVVLFDYPGYGDSGGEASIDGIMTAALAVYDHLAAGPNEGQRLALHGMSLGGFVAAQVAGARNPSLLLLEATAPDAERWGASVTPWFAKPFVDIRFDESLAAVDSVQALRGFTGRALLVVGSRGSQTRPSLMLEMHEALLREGVEAEFAVIEGPRHGDLLRNKEARGVIARFLASGGD